MQSALELLDAFQDGEEWIKSLKVGDKWEGCLVEAHKRYGHGAETMCLVNMFTDGAWLQLGGKRQIVTDQDNIIIKDPLAWREGLAAKD